LGRSPVPVVGGVPAEPGGGDGGAADRVRGPRRRPPGTAGGPFGDGRHGPVVGGPNGRHRARPLPGAGQRRGGGRRHRPRRRRSLGGTPQRPRRPHRRGDPPPPLSPGEGAAMSGTVVVTGAARGIGRAIGERLQAEGYTVVGVDIGDGLADTSFEPGQGDLTSPGGRDPGRRLGAAVTGAGILRASRLVTVSEDGVAAALDGNRGAAYRRTRARRPRLEAGSSIVNLASRAYLGNFGQFNYSMSKGGVAGMTRALALELAPDVRVNAIAPGLIATEMSMAIPEDIRTKMVDNIPLGRMGEPSEVADLVAWLIRPGYITGEVIVIGGGRSLA